MSNDNEVKITISADVSDLEKSIDSATKKVDKQADKMEKSFNDLSKSLDKVKANMNNAFKGNNTNLNGLTNQLNKLTNVATNVASKVQSALKKAFNVEGKVTVKQDVQTTNTTNANGNGGALADALLTGGTIGALMSKELAQMNRNITSSIPKSFKDATNKSEGMFSKMGTKINKIFTDLANSITDGTIGRVKHFQKLSEDLEFLLSKTKLVKNDFDNYFKLFKKGVIQVSTLDNALKNTREGLENLQKTSEARDLSVDFNKAISSLQSVRKEIGKLINDFNSGKIDNSTMVNQIMGLRGKVRAQMVSAKKELETHIEGIQREISSIDTGSFKFKLGERLMATGNQAQVAFNRIQASVNKLKAKLADTTIGKGLVRINTTIKEKVIPAFVVLQERCKRLVTSFKNIGNSAKKMGSDTTKATSMMKSGFASLISMLAPFISIFAIFNGLKTSITSYVDSLANSTKFATVFKGETQQMAKWVDELNSRVTMGKSEIMDFSSNLYRMGLNMGVAKDDAMSMSQKMTELGANLQAFTGDANAIEALAGALRGEYDSIQNYGYALDASSVKAKALAMGLDDASESSLLLARQTLLLEQSGDVLGYTADNSKSLAVQLAFLKKNFIELGQAIGSCFAGLLQVVLPVLNAIIKAVTVAFSKLSSLISGIFSAFGIKIGGSSGGISNSFGDLSDTFGDVADSSDVISDNIGETNKDIKEMAKNLASFDKLNVLNTNTSSGSSSNSGSIGSIGGGTIGSIGSMGDNAPSYNKASVEIEGWAKDLGKRIHDAIVNNPYFKSLKENFFGLVDACKNFVKSAGGWLKLFMDSGGREFLANLGDCALIIGDILITALKDGVTWITNFLNSAKGQAVIKTLGELCKWLSERLKDILLWIRDNKDMLYKLIGVVASVKLGFSAFIKVAQGISAIKTGVGLVKTALGKLPGILKGVKGAWETMKIAGLLALDKIKLAFPGVLAGAKTMLSGAVSAIGSAITAVAGALGISAGALVAIVLGVIAVLALVILNWDKVKEWGIKAWNGIKAVWSASNQWCYNNIVSPIINHFRNMWNTARDLGTRAWDGIKNTWQGMGTWYGSLGQRVSQHFSNMWQSIRNGGQSAWQYLQRVFNSGGSFFRDITSSMGNAFKQVLNMAIKGINNIIGIPFRGINSAIRGLKNVSVLGARPFQFLRELSVPQIPYLAKGGVVDSATLAMIGEGRQNEAVIPLDTFYNKLSQMFAEQNRMLMQSMQQGGNATIILQLDGKEVARGTVNNMKEMSKLGQLDMSWL